MFLSERIDARRCETLGLVNRVVPTETLLDEALAVARRITRNSPGRLRLAKQALLRNQEITSFAGAMELENRGHALLG